MAIGSLEEDLLSFGRFLGLFAKIDEDLCFEMVRIEEDLDKVQRLHSIALNRDMDPSNSEQVDKAILECIATNYDHQLKLQKDIENMRGYNSGLVKSKNAEIDTLLKELADKNHYMASAITYNSALAVSKLAGDVTNKLFSHSIAVSSPTSKGHATRPLPKQQQRKIPYTTEESRQFF
jgi:glutamate racemase